MERNFYNEEFENFLKQKADQYKMYPSDRVWRGVYRDLHHRRRWFTLAILLLLIGSGALISREMLLSEYKQAAKEINGSLETIPNFSTDYASYIEQIEEQSKPQNNKPSAKPVVISSGANVPTTANRSIGSGSANSQTLLLRIAPAASTAAPVEEAAVMSPERAASVVNSEGSTEIINDGVPAEAEASKPASASSPAATEAKEKTATPAEPLKKEPAAKKETSLFFQNQNAIPDIKNKRNLWTLQFYASPIISYRRLSNLNRNTGNHLPVAINYSDNLDNFLQHKPALGFELGTKLQLHASRSLKFYVGTQFNYSRYTIDAYNAAPERATIALNTTYLSDTISNLTSLRNFGGYSGEQVQNQYLQVSVPIGAELRIFGRKKLQFSVSGSIQPTYLLTSNAYLLSTDYKNYVKNSDLARNWNVHTNVEAFLSYQTGGIKWQFGPQFRYQLLSSYSNKYPIREYLTEYGIKFGISKTIK